MPRPAVDMTGWKVGQWTVLARAHSPNLDAYAPMCRPCHKRFDVSMATEVAA